MAEGDITVTRKELTRGIVFHGLWTTFLEQTLQIRSRKDKVTSDWMRRMIAPNLGCAAPFFLDIVDHGLAMVLLSARCRLLPFHCLPSNVKHDDRALAAGAFTEYICRAPIRTVLPADQVASGCGSITGDLLEVAAQLLLSLSRFAHGLTWSDVAMVLLVGMDDDGVGVGVPGAVPRPLPLSELAQCSHCIL